ncbi:hypothetical protein [Vibrio sp. MED222]|uniref:hypothetical protein n=1 Tax=Vibrio sp. MED222 TaxID=314290 RepID=UPI000068EAEC|nr:hypothetical protein [Vibrio sp. MED222]EAQ55528.1 hypothetical protein MED222_08908 [Vibrio sp. MED222]
MIKEIISCYLQQSGLLEISQHLSPRLEKRHLTAWKRNKQKVFADIIAACICGELKHPQKKGYSIGRDTKLMMKRTQTDSGNLLSFDFYNGLLSQPLIRTHEGLHGVYCAAYDFSDWFTRDLDKHFQFNRSYSFTDVLQVIPPETYDDKTSVEPSKEGIEEALQLNTFNIREKLYMWAIGEASQKQSGTLTQYYNKASSGRLYTKGVYGLQSLTKDMRQQVLKGYTCFDMNAAAYSILIGLCKNPDKYPTIKAYTEDRTTHRKQIANDTGATVDHVKECITALGFGSSITVSKIQKYNTKVNVPNDLIKKIKAHKFTVAFIKELGKLRTEITDKFELDEHQKTTLQEYKQKHGHYRGKYTAWFYQGYEVQALKAMQSILDEKQDCLLLHDGLYTKEQKNPVDFEQAIQKQTGLNIGIDLD